MKNWSNFECVDNLLPQEACKKFHEHGFDLSADGSSLSDAAWTEDAEHGSVRVDCYQADLPMLWLFTAKLGAPELEYEFKSSRDSVIGIGGWSLFEDC